MGGINDIREAWKAQGGPRLDRVQMHYETDHGRGNVEVYTFVIDGEALRVIPDWKSDKKVPYTPDEIVAYALDELKKASDEGSNVQDVFNADEVVIPGSPGGEPQAFFTGEKK